MGVRVGVYIFVAYEKFQLPVHATVIYFGAAPLRMKPELDAGGAQCQYRLVDISTIDTQRLVATGRPGDLVLAMLARGGAERLGSILGRVAALPPESRDRAFSQMVLLSGLRRLTKRFKMEVARMSPVINIEKNEILREIRDRGREVGRLEGERQAKATLTAKFLTQRFGPLTAGSLTAILGKRSQ